MMCTIEGSAKAGVLPEPHIRALRVCFVCRDAQPNACIPRSVTCRRHMNAFQAAKRRALNAGETLQALIETFSRAKAGDQSALEELRALLDGEPEQVAEAAEQAEQQ